MKKINFDKKVFIRNLPIILVISIVAVAGVYFSRPTKGEFDINSLNNQVQNHDQRIGALETKTDQTQTQTNQNTADINKLQQSTNTDPTSTNTSTDKTTPSTTETQLSTASDNNTWANSHGVFVYKDFLSTQNATLGKNYIHSEGQRCQIINGVATNCVENNCVIKGGTTGYKSYPNPNLPTISNINEIPPADNALYFDTRNISCFQGLTIWQIKYSNDINNKNFPGNWDIWW